MDTAAYRVRPDEPVDLSARPTRDDGGLSRDQGREQFRKLTRRLQALQEVMYAQNRHSLLVVLQAMDAGGKDSTLRNVFGPVNPQGCHVSSFKAPSTLERSHDFLWRIHQQVPPRGHIGVFNRSHYEDVLIVRVKDLAPKSVWQKRFDHINHFEKMIADEGVSVVKFYLHISKAYQQKRLQRRLDRPDKHWKFNPDDLAERARWAEYMHAFEDALSKCSQPHAPWYVVPAERRWFRNLLVAQVVVDTLEALNMKLPEPTFDPATIRIE